MSDETSAGVRHIRVTLLQQLPLLIALVVLWMLLWGNLTWLSFLTGVFFAVAVTRLFYLPPVELSGRFHLGWAIVYAGMFAWELVIASFQVAFTAIRPRGVRGNSVLEVDLRTDDDFVLTVTTIILSLIPGSIVIEADRDRSLLYLHALDTPDDASVARVRARVLEIEARVIRVLGSTEDLERIAA